MHGALALAALVRLALSSRQLFVPRIAPAPPSARRSAAVWPPRHWGAVSSTPSQEEAFPDWRTRVPTVDKSLVTWSAARSGGAGGQNVNKVNTKVMVRFPVDAEWISEEVRREFVLQQKNRINAEGDFTIASSRSRSQRQNLEDALRKIQAMLDEAAQAAFPPPPNEVKQERFKKIKKKANENRIKEKKFKADKKTSRRQKFDY